jgi:hypothetical protein
MKPFSGAPVSAAAVASGAEFINGKSISILAQDESANARTITLGTFIGRVMFFAVHLVLHLASDQTP